MQMLADELSTRFESAAIRFIAPKTTTSPTKAVTISTWPFLEAIRAVSVIVGSGGYNTVNEATATGTPLIGIARKRLYDRQEKRLQLTGDPAGVSDVPDRLATLLDGGFFQTAQQPQYTNGVHQAIALIESVS